MRIRFSIKTLLILLLCPFLSFGFDLAISRTNETCPGNGSLNFIVTNTDPAGSIVFVVYKLPDITTPYASGTNTTLNGLTAGDYRVIARETVGSVSTTQQQDITITSSFVPLTYTVESRNQACSNASTVTVTALTGTVATYAIISGPATFPPQASNTFTGLAAGVYRIRVVDSCGNAIVQAFTVAVNPPLLTTTNPSFTAVTPPSCTALVANNTIVPATGTVIAYPVQIHYILHLPTGDTHINTVLNSGDPISQDISQVIPYPGQDYIYDVILTDACGITYPLNNFIVTNTIRLSYTIQTLPCNRYYFYLNASNYSGSYTLQFIEAPAGFNPVNFNSNFPGPYNQDTTIFGSDSNFVPFGDYEAVITDECGRTRNVEFSIEDEPPVLNLQGYANGCMATDGTIIASIANYEIVTAIILAAPPTYPFPIPHDVSAQIDSAGALMLTPVTLGDYIFRIVDDCGNIYDPEDVTVEPFESTGVTIDILHGCGIGTGSVKLKGKDGLITSARITAAPTAYPFSMPHDISNNIIANGDLYLNNLPAGNYTVSVTDTCGFITTELIVIDGYTITNSSFSLLPDCGVFNVPLDFVDNLTVPETFWLQKLLDADTDTWGHPDTEVVYVNGTVPDSSTSVPLDNNTTNLNFTYNGIFRIVHHFVSYNNGFDINSGLATSPNKDCIEILAPSLTFTRALAIIDVLRIPCSTSGNFDILVQTNGDPPLQFRIIEKDGNPFLVDNGTSNIFLNVPPGIYKFEVEDSCGNSVNRTFDVSDLADLVTIYPTCNLFDCAVSITGNETFNLSSQSAIILGHQSTTDYTLSYHTSQADADNNDDPITNLTAFNPPTNPGTIYIRLVFNQLPNCYQTGSFDLITGQLPRINLQQEYTNCDGLPVELDAGTGNLPTTTYSWSNGSTAASITISDIGSTTVDVSATNNYGMCNANPLSCNTSRTITVNIADVPEIDHIDTADWTDTDNSITVVTTSNGDFEYSIDGISYQQSNVFLNLRPGLYTVYVRDPGGCRTVTQEVWLLNYPKFFTPNGDGYNETWYIKNSENEPDFHVYIFDRYGKLITNILSNGPGWDGKLNGRTLFSDDYWFQAHRQDGRIHRGHFTLKR